MSGLLIAAPTSGSGKTTLTLGLLRALRNRALVVKPGKAGPDYIDPAFHRIASGSECVNFDPWGMRAELLHRQADTSGPLIIEAMMGLYDGAADHTGSPASLARLLDLSVVLVVDCGRMSHSVGALVSGFVGFDPSVRIAGLILNRVGSARHEAMLRAGLATVPVPILGVVMQDKRLALPERHLGLVQAGEIIGIEAFMEHAAETVAAGCDIDALVALAQRRSGASEDVPCLVPPLGQRMAIASDEAFAFLYPHLVDGWRAQGAELSFFAPLRDEAPAADADAIFLPGGYPELHAGTLAAAGNFKSGVQARVEAGATVYGECGGYMVLGEGMIDAQGARHEMLGLLPLTTSFENRKRHLGYRRMTGLSGAFAGIHFHGHEFHYSSVVHEGQAERLFDASDAAGVEVGPAGLCRGTVFGSYMHIIDLAGAAL